MFLTEEFYQHIPTETFLVFQTDSMILSKNKEAVNSFLAFDFVGAPFTLQNEQGELLCHGFNGGFSLRKKSKMLEILRNTPHTMTDIEDVIFTLTSRFRPIHDIQLDFPSFEVASQFSVETIYNTNHANHIFGCHNPWRYNSWTDQNVKIMLDMYPEIETLKNLQYTLDASIQEPYDSHYLDIDQFKSTQIQWMKNDEICYR